MDFSVLVDITLRSGIADPVGSTIERALPSLGFNDVSEVTVGKTIRFKVQADSETLANEKVSIICSTFLTNPVIEDATITIRDLYSQDDE